MAKTLLSNSETLAILGLPADTITALQSNSAETFEPAANKFLTGLINKITKQQVAVMHFINPFTIFDKEPLAFGDTIENIRIDVSKGKPYSETSNDPFEKAKPTAKAVYVTENFDYQWTTTIEDKELRKACLSNNGFMKISDGIMEGFASGRNLEEYDATIAFLNNPALYANGIEAIKVKGLDDTAKSKAVTKTLYAVLADMQLPSHDNNKAKNYEVSAFADLYVIIKQDVLTDINFDYLAGVYNLDKVEVAKHFIPVRSFQTIKNTTASGSTTPAITGEDIAFAILDSRGFDNHVLLDLDTSIYNPKKHYTNYFSTLWKIFNFRTDYNARAFKIDTATEPTK